MCLLPLEPFEPELELRPVIRKTDVPKYNKKASASRENGQKRMQPVLIKLSRMPLTVQATTNAIPRSTDYPQGQLASVTRT